MEDMFQVKALFYTRFVFFFFFFFLIIHQYVSSLFFKITSNFNIHRLEKLNNFYMTF